MKKLIRSILVLFLIVMVVGCGSNALSEKEQSEYTTGMKFVDLMDVNTYEKNGSKMVKALENALNATPNDFHMLEQKGKLLSQATYFEETFDVVDCDYYYIGKIKDGKPDGYGVITNSYDANEMDIYYIGEFHNGEVENCYGMRLEGGYAGRPYAIAYEGEIAYLSSDGLYPVPADGERVITHGIDSIYNWYNGEISVPYDDMGPSKTKVARCFPKYIGEIKKGVYDGKGIEYYQNEVIYYEGEYKAGEPHGKGKKYSYEGDLIEEGEYKRGELKDGKIYREPEESLGNILEDMY